MCLFAGPCPSQRDQTLAFAVPTSSQNCNAACGALNDDPTTQIDCCWRTVNGGTTKADACLAQVQLGSGPLQVAGGTTVNDKTKPTNCLVMPSTVSGVTLTPTSPPEQQLCLCTSCIGGACADLFWRPSNPPPATCKNPSQLLPAGYNLWWGQWCRKTSTTELTPPGAEYGVTGYMRGNVCYAGTASTTQFDVWCPPALRKVAFPTVPRQSNNLKGKKV